ncbi:hypothetical protein SAMN04488008_10727 [Maribacter orientalis]|uniref:Inclusion body protein n=1 Tax=Maribacter orientalis TaxID=228957 RepID=A0A1H7U6V6_9FLAO|nr:hypothetical protein [Maribacter orientalis]SEL92703.1 hypothetical protein SAMN04488008_10727 [Maribacter orientalis]|tara:strand:- start:541 stop:999 length:459 start_codon:yes stop_codon:yes gene_type:complete
MPKPETTDVLIMLYVDTVAIQSNPNVLDCVFISSNWTDPNTPTQTPTDPFGKSDFITDVHSDSQIAWVGAVMDIANNNDHYVLVSNIVLKEDQIGINVRNPLAGPGAGRTHMGGNVNNGAKSGITTYTINFSVGSGTTIIGDYSIDPKLKMN